jgi:hypothetical protein
VQPAAGDRFEVQPAAGDRFEVQPAAGDRFEVQPAARDRFEVQPADDEEAEGEPGDAEAEEMPVTVDAGAAPVLGALDDLDHDIARAIARAVVDKLVTLVAPPMLPLVAEEVVRIMMTVHGRGPDGTANGSANGSGTANGNNTTNGHGQTAAPRSGPTGSVPSH